jgi:SAM-dependent methyltransferase
MAEVDWDERARQGVGLQSVIDPGDRNGLKNGLIDRIQWGVVQPWAQGRREVLDYGCGIGRFAQRITAAGTAYCGVDTSCAMIEAARRAHPGGRAPLVPTFVHSPDLPLPLEADRFDGCLTVGVLQCLTTADGHALRAAVAELARVLQAGGELLMIEQASASGRHSGSVSHSTSEQDYLDALAPHFEVLELQRIRLATLTRPSAAYLRWGAAWPARGAAEGWLARREHARARSADAAALQAQVYHDVAIRAARRS